MDRCDSAQERIKNKVIVDDNGCWLWTGCINASGYGAMRFKKKPWLAHRLSYTAFVGEIPEGMQLDHLCRNTKCVNPKHLEPVTPRENALRSESIAARRARATHCKHGHPFDESNTIWRGRMRQCRTCAKIQHHEAYLRRRVKKRQQKEVD